MGTKPPRKGHIFLSHSGADTQAARHLAEILRRNALEVWFDQDNIHPGDRWQSTLEEAITQASAMLVYIGASGIQTWVDREVRFGLVRNTHNRDAFRFIPVLGEGSDPAKLPPFVQQHQYVDLRNSHRDPEQIRRLIEVLRNASPEPAIPSEYWNTHSPFRSLQTFGPEDSWLFFGRDQDTDELLTRLGRAPALAVIGNSGSRKSSLIQAGLIPALRRGRFRHDGNTVDSWRIAVFRPSGSPFDYLAEVLSGQLAPELSPKDRAEFITYCKEKLPTGGDALRTVIAALPDPTGQTSANAHVLLVADQFEELFTLVPDPAIRSRYIDSLLAAARLDGAVPVHLVLALRADFYGHCLDYPKLSACLDTNLYNVPLMSPPQLREAIENRLALASARAEAGLIDSLLADVGAEPGNLALLEHALAQLWEKSVVSGRTLTSDAYDKMGRLRGALGRHADEVYHSLDEVDQHLAQRIFLELVQLGEGAQDTGRRVTKESFLHLGTPEQVERLITLLASKRLVATSGKGPLSSANCVEVSHEALIREWPALREWLKDNRDYLRLGRLLLQTAEEWRDLNRDPSALMRGIRLAQGLEWIARHQDAPPVLREFLKASSGAEEEVTQREREALEREVTRFAELVQHAQARAEAEVRLRQEADRRRVAEETAAVQARRSAKRSRKLSYALGALLLIAAAAAWLARQQQLTAQSQTLAAQAEQLIGRDRPAALDLAIRSWRTARTTEANLAVAHAFPQLLATLEDHTGRVIHTAFSPDGQRIVTASDDRTAQVWNAADGQLLAKLEGHTDQVNHAAFSPDGQRIVTASGDRTARVWNAASGQLLATLQGHTAGVLHAAFSPDGQRIVTTSDDQTPRVWNVANGHLLGKLEGHTDHVWQAKFSPDSQRIVTASYDHTARVWNAADGQLLAKLEGHTDRVGDAEFSPDGLRIVTASLDHTARVWNAANGQLLAKLEGHTDHVWQAGFSPDGLRIVTASTDHTARVWNVANGRLLAELDHTRGVVHAAFSPDGKRIVTVSFDQTAQVWNLANGQLLARLADHTVSVLNVAFSPDGKHIVTTSEDNPGRVWNADNGQLQATLKGHSAIVSQAAFSPDGQRIVTAGRDQTARVWSAANGQLLAELEGHTDSVYDAEFSPDGLRIVTASLDHTARLWNAANGLLLFKLEGHTGGVVHAAFSPDGKQIVTASWDHTACVWNAANGQLLAKLEGHTASVWYAAFSPDRQRIVTASQEDNTARVWNATNGQLLSTIEGPTGGAGPLGLSLDGQRIVVASFGHNTARVWNPINGQLLATIEDHLYSPAAFSPDGQRIVASSGTTAGVWNTTNGQLLAKLEGHILLVRQAAFSPDGLRIVTASDDKTARIYRVVTLSDIAQLLGK